MPRERQINANDLDRAEALQDKLRENLGDSPSQIRTPEEARKSALIDKMNRDAGY
ncbi:hypothetical protein [Asticcacaulis sp. YBE204]|uniref:hypothetical protein n=1 Tax=Asticcacaulis sp. YBE204 TaxID=1282363 RepID=UPI0003C3D7C5|nr:hypothetical protein [Asticcacaulis sp. YBE204]ESQ79134.1 hypothetical protein AEYBE204_10630 [Asticcacaulis sp. YBE204]